VHEQITLHAAGSVVESSANYNGFIATIGGPVPLSVNGGPAMTPFLWMIEGSAREDDNDNDTGGRGGFRSLNHFYDPLTGQGLSDWPAGLGSGLLGTSSFFWVSTLKAPGLDVFFNKGTINDWSWKDARNYELLGLIGTNKIDRDRNLAQTFRALGDVMHLLEDTSQPQHVRNEQHLDKYLLKYFYESPIEIYGAKNVDKLKYTHGMLDWRAAGFNKMHDFWDRDYYNGTSAQPFIDNEDAGQPTKKLGLAEFCNGNFIGDRHTYPELMGASSPFRYSFPSLYGGTDFDQLQKNPGLYGKPTSIGIVGAGLRYIVGKTGQGRLVTHHAAVNYLVASNPDIGLSPGVYSASVDDPDVLKDYHDILIPEAIKYSAGLLDYYFRGTVSASIVGFDTNSLQYTNQIVNTSAQDFSGGKFYLVLETNNVRNLIQQTDLIGILPSGGSTNMIFSGPLPTNQAKLFLVYQGTIGVTNGPTPLDPVDAGIAIAVTTVTEPLIFDLSWDNATAEIDLYLTDPCNVTWYEPDLLPGITSPCCNVVGGDDEDVPTQHMVANNCKDGSYQLWANFEGQTENQGWDGNPVNITLKTHSVDFQTTESFTLTSPASGQGGGNWPTGISGPTTLTSWYVRKAVTIQNGKAVDY
jgi:hypothetical protein